MRSCSYIKDENNNDVTKRKRYPLLTIKYEESKFNSFFKKCLGLTYDEIYKIVSDKVTFKGKPLPPYLIKNLISLCIYFVHEGDSYKGFKEFFMVKNGVLEQTPHRKKVINKYVCTHFSKVSSKELIYYDVFKAFNIKTKKYEPQYVKLNLRLVPKIIQLNSKCLQHKVFLANSNSIQSGWVFGMPLKGFNFVEPQDLIYKHNDKFFYLEFLTCNVVSKEEHINSKIIPFNNFTALLEKKEDYSIQIYVTPKK
jgi:hypothetical protein